MKTTLSFLLSLLGLLTLIGCVTLAHPQYAPGVLHTKGGVDDYLSAVGAYDYGISKEELERRLSLQPLASCVKGHYELRDFAWPKKAKQPPVAGPYYLLVYVTPSGEERPLPTIWLSDNGVMKYRVDSMGVKEGYMLTLLPGAPEAIRAAQARQTADERLNGELYWRNERAFKAFLKKPHTWHEFQAFMAELKASNPHEAANLWRIKEATWNNTEDLNANSAFRAQADPDGIIPCVENRIHWDRIMAVRLEPFIVFFQVKDNLYPVNTEPGGWRLPLVFANLYLNGDEITAVMLYENPWYGCYPGSSVSSSDGPVGIGWYALQDQFKVWCFADDVSHKGRMSPKTPLEKRIRKQ